MDPSEFNRIISALNGFFGDQLELRDSFWRLVRKIGEQLVDAGPNLRGLFVNNLNLTDRDVFDFLVKNAVIPKNHYVRHVAVPSRPPEFWLTSLNPAPAFPQTPSLADHDYVSGLGNMNGQGDMGTFQNSQADLSIMLGVTATSGGSGFGLQSTSTPPVASLSPFTPPRVMPMSFGATATAKAQLSISNPVGTNTLSMSMGDSPLNQKAKKKRESSKSKASGSSQNSVDSTAKSGKRTSGASTTGKDSSKKKKSEGNPKPPKAAKPKPAKTRQYGWFPVIPGWQCILCKKEFMSRSGWKNHFLNRVCCKDD